jgi:hypothetical protein
MAEAVQVLDASGAPALLASSGKADGAPGRASGAPSVGGGGGSGASSESPPAAASGSDRRRRDAVADAARTLGDLSPQGVREFVVRRWRGARALEDSDVEQFSKDAIAQREDDLADALDSRLNRMNGGKATVARVVRVTPPRAWLKRTLASLPDDQLAQVLLRLRARGWTEAQIKRDVLKPYTADREVTIPQLSLEDPCWIVAEASIPLPGQSRAV